MLAYVRRSRSGDPVVVVVNFAGVPHEGYRLPLPTLPLVSRVEPVETTTAVDPSLVEPVSPLVEPVETPPDRPQPPSGARC